MSNTTRTAPPTTQAEYDIWRAAQRTAAKPAAAKRAKPVAAKPAPKYETSAKQWQWRQEWQYMLTNLGGTFRQVAKQMAREQHYASEVAAARAEQTRRAVAAEEARRAWRATNAQSQRAADGKRGKAVRAGHLAMSAERIGSDAEATQAGRTAGRTARQAGMTMADLASALAGIGPRAWAGVVEGFATN